MLESEVTPDSFKAPLAAPEAAANIEANEIAVSEDISRKKEVNSVQKKRKSQVDVPLPYTEPEWSGTPPPIYSFEIIKNGTVLSNMGLKSSLIVFGRLEACDVVLEHPSVSRYHAVIQYCQGDEARQRGFYLYDLGSTHGTFLNKEIITPKIYYKLKVGYIVKFGGSSRLHIFQGPEEIEEKKATTPLTKDEEICTWGMGEDASEEEPDSVNPFALSTTNEDLYLDDPKKTLRGWFEREGYEVEYSVEEKGFRTFVCSVKLPVDTPSGEFLTVEASVTGKKKEAVVACALEACRTLDRMGLLRQSHHESRQKKKKKWEENDYYDSDEDTFYDRTGEIEKRREMRKKLASKTNVETFETIETKLKIVVEEIDAINSKIESWAAQKAKSQNADGDSLETFMSGLQSSSDVPTDKFERRRLKMRLIEAEKEKAHLERLLNIARPVPQPPLKKHAGMIGKRPKSKLQIPAKKEEKIPTSEDKDEKMIEEVESDEDKKCEENSADFQGINKDEKIKDNLGQKYGLQLPFKGTEKKKNDKRQNDNEADNGSKIKSVTNDKEKKDSKIGQAEPIEDNASKTSLTYPIEEACKESKTVLADPAKNKDNVQGKHCDTDNDMIVEYKNESENSKPVNLQSMAETVKRLKKDQSQKQKKHADVYNTQSAEYTTWTPPSNQSGDGMTHLNAKYGY